MAVEIISRRYEFRLGSELSGSDEEDDDDPNDIPSLFYNNLHDLESLWWIAIYSVFRIPGILIGKMKVEGEVQVMSNELAGSLLFHRSVEVGKRV